MTYRSIAFNVMLDSEDKARLEELATSTGHSKGQILREALEHKWMHQCRSVPMCANGFNCFVPQMHTAKTAPGHVNTVPPAAANPNPSKA